jgi:hypothetical protein
MGASLDPLTPAGPVSTNPIRSRIVLYAWWAPPDEGAEPGGQDRGEEAGREVRCTGPRPTAAAVPA